MKKGLFNFLWTGFGTNTTALRGIGMALACLFGVFFLIYYGIRGIIRVVKRTREKILFKFTSFNMYPQ